MSEQKKSSENFDIQAFLTEEEARLKEDLAFVADNKSSEKTKKIKRIMGIIAIFSGAFLATAYALGSEYDREKERKYQAAQELQEQGMYEDAIWIYDNLYGYKRSKSFITECEKHLEAIETERTYQSALAYFEAKDYKSAAYYFNEVIGYEDSEEKRNESFYKYGEVCVENEDYNEAYYAFSNAKSYMDSEALADKYSFGLIEAGDLFTLGTYEQDRNLTNGTEDIRWIVLDVQGSKALLLSEYVLAVEPFNQEGEETEVPVEGETEAPAEGETETPAEGETEVPAEDETGETENVTTELCYANSSLRKFVNGTFYDAAFSEDEKAMIETTIIRENNLEGTEIAKSENKVFLLTSKMVEKYAKNDDFEIAQVTNALKGNYSSSKKIVTPWWTCTVDRVNENSAATIDSKGKELYSNVDSLWGVRPAIWGDFLK